MQFVFFVIEFDYVHYSFNTVAYPIFTRNYTLTCKLSFELYHFVYWLSKPALKKAITAGIG